MHSATRLPGPKLDPAAAAGMLEGLYSGEQCAIFPDGTDLYPN